MTRFWVTSRKPKLLVDKFLLGETVGTSHLHICDGILNHHPGDDSTGYFVQPTVILTKDPKSVTMVEEIFGPVLTVGAMAHSFSLPPSRKSRFTSLRTPTMILLST